MGLAQANPFRLCGPVVPGSIAKASGWRFHIRRQTSQRHRWQIERAGLVPALTFCMDLELVNRGAYFGELGYVDLSAVVGSFQGNLNAFGALRIL